MVARNRVVLSGTLGTAEVWSTSLHYILENGQPIIAITELQEWAENIAGALTNLSLGSNLAQKLSSQGSITEVSIYYYDAVGPARFSGSAPMSVTGDQPAVNPYQTSSVFSLRTGRSGASYRGRCYWPAIGAPITTAGLFGTGSPANAAVGDFIELLALIGNEAPTAETAVPVVYSSTRDLVTPVTTIEWDTVPDIQRRRSDALTGTRYSLPLFEPA